MSIINRIQPVPQPRRRSSVEQDQAQRRKKLTLAEIGIVSGAGVSGLVGLFLLAWLVLPHSGNILPFMVASALPLFTLFAVVYQAVVYRRQWNVMLDSLKQTDRVIDKMQGQLNEIQKQSGILDRTLAETAKIAEHSEKAVEVARQSTEYAQRAYVSVTERAWLDTGFNLSIENSGNTPAREVTVQWIVDAGMSPPKLPNIYDTDYKYPEYVLLGLLAPRAPEHIFMSCTRSLTASEEEEYREYPDILHWWVTGKIYYRDIFQDNSFDEGRETYFCFFYDQKARAVRAYSEGNEEKEYRKSKNDKGNPN